MSEHNEPHYDVFKFDELGDKAKERARDWYRQHAFDHDWWDSVYEDAKTCLALAGFDIDRIYFSGFWSQGDGACFEGAWSAKDVNVAKLKEHAPKDEELHRIVDALAEIARQHQDASFNVKHAGHYHHEHCTRFSDVEYGDDDPIETLPYGGPEYQERVAYLDGRTEELIELARDAMRWIYAQLEAEYEFLNSDEQVDELIRANAYEFTEEGRYWPNLERSRP